MTKGAVIVETRFTPNLYEIIQERHMKFIPDDWGLKMYLSEANANLLEGVEWGRESEIVIIPDDMDIDKYNRLLTSASFWQGIPFDKVLIFQTDSCLLKNGIEQFLDVDFIGAELPFRPYRGNGGLSLRTKKIMIELINTLRWSPEWGNEDIYYSNLMNSMGLNLAPVKECRKFSVESIFTLGSIGYHAIDKYLSIEECEQIRNQYANNIR